MLYSGPSQAHRELAQLPVPTFAQFTQSDANTTVIQGDYIVRDFDNKLTHIVTKTFTLSTTAPEPIVTTTTGVWGPDLQGLLVSPSGKHQAMLKESIDIHLRVTRRVEIWSDLRLVASFNVSEVHGAFLSDVVFQSISFSPSETAIVYSAEANPETLDGDPYPKHRYQPHFGESYPNIRRPVLVMVRWADASTKLLETKLVKVISPTLSDVVLGQAVFATDYRIFATGFKKSKDGRWLGIKWCLNRPSSIWEVTTSIDPTSDDFRTAANVLIDIPGRACRSPRILFDEDGSPKQLFWLSNPTGVPTTSASLHVRDLFGDRSSRVLVDSVSDSGAHEFPGLYTGFNILLHPFLDDTTPSIVLQTIWGSSETIVSVNIETGVVTHERPRFGGSPLEAWTVWATDGRSKMICSTSSFTSPPKLVLLTLNEGGWVSRVLDNPVVSAQMQGALDDLSLSVIPIPDRYPVETIVLQSKKAAAATGPKPYCITFPHGGPHHTDTTAFLPLVTALALEGYTVSLPNYTGSLGFGDKYVQKLVGLIGILDIADCIASGEELVKRGISDMERQLVLGGSHGGFITGNLIGQFPGVFKAAAMINPVTSLGEFVPSDIPEFPYVEIGLPFQPDTGVTPEVYKKLYDASPVAHVGSVRTPLLLILGESDLRVPATQGKSYFHALKARGVPVEMLTFAGEGHLFEGVEAIRVTFESIRDWFREYTTEERL